MYTDNDMFIDWLKVSQDFGYELPQVTDVIVTTWSVATSEHLSSRQPWFRHEGSFSTSIKIEIRGSKITIDGNPSRFGRLDNLFGFTTLDQCFALYNQILRSKGLPEFTRCTRVEHRQSEEGTKAVVWSDGAVIERIDLTSNVSVGEGNTLDYLRALSTQRIGHSIGHLWPNGRTVDWTSAKGNARLVYRKVYCKENELNLHLVDSIKRRFGSDSKEYSYVLNLLNYCKTHGIVRYEQSLKAEFLKRKNLCFYGLFDESIYQSIHNEFLSFDDKLQVTAMDFESISDRLLSSGVCPNVRAANTTAIYAMQWQHGKSFDFNKKQVKTHRARLRRIGIDIANPCDVSKFTPVFIKRCVEVEKQVLSVAAMPSWYQRPCHLQLVA